MKNVYLNAENFLVVGNDWMQRLKESAKQSPRKLARLCMHRDTNDVVQEMILAFTRDCIIPPNAMPGKSESLTVVEGSILLVLFDDDGRVLNRVEMGPVGGEKPFMYRLCSASWHTMIPLTDDVIVHECIEGPFVKVDVVPPTWIPSEPDALKQFLAGLRA